MALYHLTAKTGTRGTGASALAKAQYIQREARYARVPDAVVYTTSRNLPSFAGGSAAAYWDAADLYERANGRLFKEVEFALPIELPPTEQRALAESFAEELLAGETLPYTLAIHEGRGHNPHCHVLVSERVNDGVAREASQWFRRWNERSPEQGGARKSRALHPRKWLEAIREKWAELVNRALERAGVRERVDHRSLGEQGIERVAQIHLGPNVARMEKRGLRTERGEEAELISTRNRSLAERRADVTIEPAGKTQELDRDAPDSAPSRAIGSDLEGHGDSSGATQRVPQELATTNPVEPEEVDRAPLPKGASEGPASAEQEPEIDATSVAIRATPHPDERDLAPAESAAARVEERRSREPERVEPIDRTERAVLKQLRAMGCEVFEIGIREQSSGRMLQRTWTPELVRESLPFLKRMNALGNDIFVRPAAHHSHHGLVLLDDLTPAALGRLERDGRDPALAVETSPGNYQAWIRVPDRTSDAERGEIARRLAQEYDADPGSTSARHYGRLAGFTNRKDAYRSPEGLHPFALLRSAKGREAPDGERLLQQAARALRERERAPSRASEEALLPTQPVTPESRRAAVELYRSHMRELQQLTSDLSRCDFTAAVRLVALGYNPATIRQAVREGSPDLEVRKRGHVEDYVYRTVDVALRFHERQRGRDRERDDLER